MDFCVNPPPNKNKGEPYFRDTDNPGRWKRFYFWFSLDRESLEAHYLPTGYVTVPNNDNGERVVEGGGNLTTMDGRGGNRMVLFRTWECIGSNQWK